MAEETFRPRKINQEDLAANEALAAGEALRKAAAKDAGDEDNPLERQSETGMKISGNVPKAFMDAIRQQKAGTETPHHGRERPRNEPMYPPPETVDR